MFPGDSETAPPPPCIVFCSPCPRLSDWVRIAFPSVRGERRGGLVPGGLCAKIRKHTRLATRLCLPAMNWHLVELKKLEQTADQSRRIGGQCSRLLARAIPSLFSGGGREEKVAATVNSEMEIGSGGDSPVGGC